MRTSNSDYSSQNFIEVGIIEIFGEGIERPGLNPDKDFMSLVACKKNFVQQLGQDVTNGLFIRAGRAAYYYWMSQNAASLGWKDAGFRLLPPLDRTKKALSGFLDWLKQEGLLDAELTGSSESWVVTNRTSTTLKDMLECNYFLGMMQELVSWAGGGKFFPAREEQCQAAGAEFCIFKVDRLPAN